jgi:hypothetical protein
MSLQGEVQGPIASVPGFDSDTIITAAAAQQFYAAGYKFCLRYLSLVGQESPQDLSTAEATDVLTSGLALMPVQHSRKAGWLPSQGLGQQYGQDAATNAQSVGFPIGVNVWCDLEGVSGQAAQQDVIDYCEAWYAAVDAAGYIPGLYVGAGALLTSVQLSNLSFLHYWRSLSRVPETPARDYQLIQFFPSIAAYGIDIDLDVTQNDNEGGQVQWLRIATLAT